MGMHIMPIEPSLIDKQEIQRYSQIFKALGHPSRLLIAQRLSQGKCCVCELTELVGADISTVSKHLSVLRNAGIVSSEREGVKIHYQLELPCLGTFLSCVQNFLRNRNNPAWRKQSCHCPEE